MRVTLRQLDLGDATPRYLGWLRQPEVRRWIHARPTTLSGLQRYVRGQLTTHSVMFWAILANGRHVGNLKAERDEARGLATLGILLGEGRGRGIGTRALRLATRWCFRHWQVDQVNAGIHPRNWASIRAFERAGFEILWPDRVWATKDRP